MSIYSADRAGLRERLAQAVEALNSLARERANWHEPDWDGELSRRVDAVYAVHGALAELLVGSK